MFCCVAGPSVARSHGCVPMAATGSCWVLVLGLFCGWYVSGGVAAFRTMDVWLGVPLGLSVLGQGLWVALGFFQLALRGWWGCTHRCQKHANALVSSNKTEQCLMCKHPGTM